jgi:uncharacterized protein (UPF0332 family)
MLWDEIGRENLRAAHYAKEGAHWRTAVSRAYYAAFDAINFVLLPVESPPPRYRTLRHQDLQGLIRKHLTGFSVAANRELRTTISRLHKARLAADYDERLTHDSGVVVSALRDALAIFHKLGVDHG